MLPPPPPRLNISPRTSSSAPTDGPQSPLTPSASSSPEYSRAENSAPISVPKRGQITMSTTNSAAQRLWSPHAEPVKAPAAASTSDGIERDQAASAGSDSTSKNKKHSMAREVANGIEGNRPNTTTRSSVSQSGHHRSAQRPLPGYPDLTQRASERPLQLSAPPPSNPYHNFRPPPNQPMNFNQKPREPQPYASAYWPNHSVGPQSNLDPYSHPAAGYQNSPYGMEMIPHYGPYSPPQPAYPYWFPGHPLPPPPMMLSPNGPTAGSEGHPGPLSVSRSISTPGSPKLGPYAYQPFEVDVTESEISSSRIGVPVDDSNTRTERVEGSRRDELSPTRGGTARSGSSQQSQHDFPARSNSGSPHRSRSTLSSRATPFSVPAISSVIPLTRGHSSVSTRATSPALFFADDIPGPTGALGLAGKSDPGRKSTAISETCLSPATSNKDLRPTIHFSPDYRHLSVMMPASSSVAGLEHQCIARLGPSEGTHDDVDKFGKGIWGNEDLPMIRTEFAFKTEQPSAGSHVARDIEAFAVLAETLIEQRSARSHEDMGTRSPGSSSARTHGDNAHHPAGTMELDHPTSSCIPAGSGQPDFNSESTRADMDLSVEDQQSANARWMQAHAALKVVWEQTTKENAILRQTAHSLANDLKSLHAASTVDDEQASSTLKSKKGATIKPSVIMPFMHDQMADEMSLQEQAEMRQRPGSTTFAAILLDADYSMFDIDLIKKGADGGRLAALALSTTVYELCSAAMPPELCPQCFLVQIVINQVNRRCLANEVVRIDGGRANACTIFQEAVANRLVKIGHIVLPDTFRDFCSGFSVTHDLFDIVLVKTRESGQAKIKEHLRLYMNVDACKLCLLGSSQAAAFEDLLDGFHAIGQFDKLHLIRTAGEGDPDPFDRFGGPERVHSISGMYARRFHSEGYALDGNQGEPGGLDAASTERLDELQGLAAPADDAQSVVTDKTQASIPAAVAHTLAKPPSLYTRDGDDFVTVLSRRKKPMDMTLPRPAVGTKAKAAKFADELIKGGDKKKGSKARRPGISVLSGSTSAVEGLTSSQRHHRQLSDPNGAFDSADYSNMKQLNPRPCHMEYLIGRCPNRKCNYGHDYELTDGEMAAIRTLAKEMVRLY